MRILFAVLAVSVAIKAQTVPEAKAFLEEAEATLLKQSNYLNRAQWLQ